MGAGSTGRTGGANIIGAAGNVTQTYMGALPPTGQWVRLAVPAAQVGLEGSTLNGMAFTLYGGRATWDYAGKDTTAQPATALSSSANPSLVGASVTFTAKVTGTNPTGSVNFTDGGSTISGCGAVALAGAGNVRTAACSTSSLAAGSHSIVANYSGDGANAASNSAPLSQVVNAATAIIWVEDAVPSGATMGSDGGDGWNWVSSNPTPYSGALAHQSALAGGEHQHYFYGATATLAVGVGDTLFAYVYLDPANPPSEVMLQWNDGSWEHRAYWGSEHYRGRRQRDANLHGWLAADGPMGTPRGSGCTGWVGRKDPQRHGLYPLWWPRHLGLRGEMKSSNGEPAFARCLSVMTQPFLHRSGC